MKALRPRIQQIVDEHSTLMLAGRPPADLVAALPLPVPVAGHLRAARRARTPTTTSSRTAARRLLRQQPIPPRTGGPGRATTCGLPATSWSPRRRSDPADDLLGRQVVKQPRGRRLRPRGDLVGLAFLLLVAGHETTANMISLGTLALLENPDAARGHARPTPARRSQRGRGAAAVLHDRRRRRSPRGHRGRRDRRRADPRRRGRRRARATRPTATRRPSPSPDDLDLDRGARHHVAVRLRRPPVPRPEPGPAGAADRVRHAASPHPGPAARGARSTTLPFKDDAIIYGVYELPVTW